MDRLDIRAGQHWDREVERALKNCKSMIAVLSPDSVGSANVMDEVSYALNKDNLVVPLLIRSCEIPLRLERLQYADFTADYDTGFSQLLRALGIEQPIQPLGPAATREPVAPEPPLPKQPEPTPDAPEGVFCEELCRNLKESEPNWPGFALFFVEIAVLEGV